jgi:thioesterase domain-containing protein/acyl carrier protein
MIPSAFVVLDLYPLTPVGKVDRARVPAPAPESAVADDDYAAPGDDTERLLCRIWSEVLGVKRVGVDDNFFELGGHSLLGAQLFARLSDEFGQVLPLALLFETPTVRKLAEYLRSSAPLDGCVSLVAITTASARPSVFAVGGIGGNVIGFADLARALGPDQGFYALQSVGLDGTREPLGSIEAMAQLYLSEMRSVQPRGPYALIGACFGATVAYEMARRLTDGGEEVAFLGLLDPTRQGGEETGTPIERSRGAISRATVANRFIESPLQVYRRELDDLRARERIVYIGRKLRTLLRQMRGSGSLEGVRKEIDLVKFEMNLAKVSSANIAALRRFRRQPISGPVKVIGIFETSGRAQSRAGFDWGTSSAAKVVRHTVAGIDSGDMLKGENARILAARLAEELRRAFEPE